MESAKECVTTHLPNELALKMDGAEVSGLDSAVFVNAKQKRVGGRVVCDKALAVRLRGTDNSADLGGSSNYHFENK